MDQRDLERYKSGRWVSRMPNKTGSYWVCTEDGKDAGTTSIIEINGRLEDINVYPLKYRDSEARWKGYYWSEPIPKPQMKEKKNGSQQDGAP
jgi:hypothetical protein